MINYYAYPGYARLNNQEIFEVIAKELGTSIKSLSGGVKTSSRNIQNCKKISTMILKDALQLTFEEISNLHKNSMPQTAMNNYYKGKNLINSDRFYRNKYEHVSNIISKLIRIR